MSMHIKITNDNVGDTDLEFVQPKFHFGQLLEDRKGEPGIVVQMSFEGHWEYGLFYTQLDILSRWIPETELASTSTTVEATSENYKLLSSESNSSSS